MARTTTDGPQWSRLGLSLGIAVMAYMLGFQPVLGVFRKMDADTANRQALIKKLSALEAENRQLAATLRSEEASVNVKAAAVQKLSSELKTVQTQEKTLSSQIQVSAQTPAVGVPSIGTVPTVHTTTGASGRP